MKRYRKQPAKKGKFHAAKLENLRELVEDVKARKLAPASPNRDSVNVVCQNLKAFGVWGRVDGKGRCEFKSDVYACQIVEYGAPLQLKLISKDAIITRRGSGFITRFDNNILLLQDVGKGKLVVSGIVQETK